jgi:hypothetical protein
VSYDAPLAPPQSSSGNATLALVLGIVGLVGGAGSCCCCMFAGLGFCAPLGWYFGQKELKAIRAGFSPAAGEGAARAGMICGIIGTALLALYLLAIVCYVALVGFAVALDSLKQGGIPRVR